MKKSLLFLGMMFLTAPAAYADITHKLSSSVQLTVNAAATQVDRIGNTYSVSGNGVSLDVAGGAGSEDLNVGGLGTLSSGVASSAVLPTAYQTTDGASFSFTNSFTQGDAMVTSAPTTGSVSALSSQVSTAAGTGTPAGTITTAGAMTLTAAGSGTSATGQFVSELTIK